MKDSTKRTLFWLVFYLVLCVGVTSLTHYLDTRSQSSGPSYQYGTYQPLPPQAIACNYMPKGHKFMYVTVYRDGYPLWEVKAVKYALCNSVENGYMIAHVWAVDSNGRIYSTGGQGVSYAVSTHKI